MMNCPVVHDVAGFAVTVDKAAKFCGGVAPAGVNVPFPVPGPAPVARTIPGTVHGPAAFQSPVTFGASIEQSISAPMYASPCQKNEGSVVLGMSCNVPGVGDMAARNNASSAEFQKPSNSPSHFMRPGTNTAFVSPKQETSS